MITKEKLGAMFSQLLKENMKDLETAFKSLRYQFQCETVEKINQLAGALYNEINTESNVQPSSEKQESKHQKRGRKPKSTIENQETIG